MFGMDVWSSTYTNYRATINKRQPQWASYQIRNIAVCACAGNAGNVFPATGFASTLNLLNKYFDCLRGKDWLSGFGFSSLYRGFNLSICEPHHHVVSHLMDHDAIWRHHNYSCILPVCQSPSDLKPYLPLSRPIFRSSYFHSWWSRGLFS